MKYAENIWDKMNEELFITKGEFMEEVTISL